MTQKTLLKRTEQKKEKKRRNKGEVLDDIIIIMKMMKVMTDGLRDSDKMFIELEEKRLKFEEQQRREERQFQLCMVQMLQSGMRGNSYFPSYEHGSSPPAGMHYNPPDLTDDYWLV